MADTESLTSLAFAALAAVVAVTCAAGNSAPPPSAAPPVASSSPPIAPVMSSAPAPLASVAPSAPTPAKPPVPGAIRLPRFYEALRSLERAERKESGRVLWLGDSHTAADYWVHPVRTRLAKRFGNGGPGMIQFGLDRYHHGAIKVLSEGKWKKEPPSPA